MGLDGAWTGRTSLLKGGRQVQVLLDRKDGYATRIGMLAVFLEDPSRPI